MREKYVWTALAIVGLWAAVAVASIFSPDLVIKSGDLFGKEVTIPIGAILSPLFGLVATIFVVRLGRQS